MTSILIVAIQIVIVEILRLAKSRSPAAGDKLDVNDVDAARAVDTSGTARLTTTRAASARPMCRSLCHHDCSTGRQRRGDNDAAERYCLLPNGHVADQRTWRSRIVDWPDLVEAAIQVGVESDGRVSVTWVPNGRGGRFERVAVTVNRHPR